MFVYGLPTLYALIVWWFSTGAILFLDHRPRSTHRTLLTMALIPLAVALWGLAKTQNDSGTLGTYSAFTYAILVWSWQEMAFLMGFITGPSAAPCPPGLAGIDRFRAAARAVIYHELALLVSLGMIVVITRSGVNHVGAMTFLVLWVMRLSAKFNLFLGVRNRSEELLPQHLKYLQTFFRRRPFNAFFPVSVGVASLAAVIGWAEVFSHDPMDGQYLSLNFACALLTLAILEHLFMVLPIPANALWAWATPARR